MTRMTRTTPGAIAPSGAVTTVLCASCNRRPQDELGGGAPRPEVREARLGEDGDAEQQAQVDADGGPDVGQDVLPDDSQRTGTGRACSRDVLLRQDSLGDDTGESGHDRRHGQPDGHHHREERCPSHGHEQHGQQEQGKGDHDVHARGQHVIQPAVGERCRQTDGHADRSTHGHGPEADDEGDAGADHELREEVPAQPVRAEPVCE